MSSRLPMCVIAVVLTIAAVAAIPVAAHEGHEHTGNAPTVEHAVRVGEGDHVFESVAGWCRRPEGAPLGNTHGAIVIDRAGNVYFNTDTERSIMVHAADGRFLRSFAADYVGIHGMVIRVEDGTEFLYAAHLGGKQVVKFRMDGSVVWTLGVPLESGKYDDPAAYNPTGVAVGPDGDVYVADGYGRNWIHQFTKDRAYVRSFGGHGREPGRFRTCHGLAIDERGATPSLLVCDRENRRLQRFTLEGEHIDVPITGLRRPCGVSFRGDEVAVAELEGRVTILDGGFQVLAHLGDNPDRGQWANNGVPAEAWKEGVFTAPHACCFDDAGNLYVMDWNATGRISKLERR